MLIGFEPVGGCRFRQAHPSSVQVDTGAWHELDRALFRSSIEQRFCQPSLCFERRRSTPSLRSDAAELRCAFRQGPERRKNRRCRDHCVVQASPDAQTTTASKVVARPAPPRGLCGCTQPIFGTHPKVVRYTPPRVLSRASCGSVVRWFQI